MRFHVGIWSAIVTAACGGSSGATGVTGGNPPPPAGPATQTISMTDYAFSPASPTIKAGTIVRWVNNGATSHTATSDAGVSPAFDTGTLTAPSTTTDPYGDPRTSPGGAFEATLTPGTYTYHCRFHGVPGSVPGTMTGTITVTP